MPPSSPQLSSHLQRSGRIKSLDDTEGKRTLFLCRCWGHRKPSLFFSLILKKSLQRCEKTLVCRTAFLGWKVFCLPQARDISGSASGRPLDSRCLQQVKALKQPHTLTLVGWRQVSWKRQSYCLSTRSEATSAMRRDSSWSSRSFRCPRELSGSRNQTDFLIVLKQEQT